MEKRIMELYKYQGAGNDFLIADNRDGTFHPTASEIEALCDRHYGLGADGLMLLESAPAPKGKQAANAPVYDFKMVYYNSDGSGGMMCGNGGRCITAFASDLGITPHSGTMYKFIADDGPHSAEILAPGVCKTIRLQMVDVEKIMNIDVKSFFLNTGTRHFVKFISNIENYDVVTQGRTIRKMRQFAPLGTNVNFVDSDGDKLLVRTYEKGVEDETFACGTGITASAIAAVLYYGNDPERRADIGRTIHRTAAAPKCEKSAPETKSSGKKGKSGAGDRIHINVRALRDDLSVDFIQTDTGAKDVWLTGPAAFVAKITLPAAQ